MVLDCSAAFIAGTHKSHYWQNSGYFCKRSTKVWWYLQAQSAPKQRLTWSHKSNGPSSVAYRNRVRLRRSNCFRTGNWFWELFTIVISIRLRGTHTECLTLLADLLWHDLTPVDRIILIHLFIIRSPDNRTVIYRENLLNFVSALFFIPRFIYVPNSVVYDESTPLSVMYISGKTQFFE